MSITLLVLVACGGDPACPEGQVLRDGACEDYVAGDPVEAEVWSPAPGATWQWQLLGEIDTDLDVEMFDVDLFEVPDATLETLAEDRVLICYFSAGSSEDWRPDVGALPAEAVGRRLQGWGDERWLDIRHPAVRDLVEARLDRAVERGCHGVEPDNVDGWDNRTGFDLTATEQLDFNRFFADAAHTRDLSVGLKNDLAQLEDLEPWFDWALNEECHAYGECGRLEVFTGAAKAAFHVEYPDDWADAPDLAEEVCGRYPDLSTLIKPLDLTAERIACP